MKVHKTTLAEMDEPGSIWAAVDMAKWEHRSVMRYRREKKWDHQFYCRQNREAMMRAIRVIARGQIASMDPRNRRTKA